MIKLSVQDFDLNENRFTRMAASIASKFIKIEIEKNVLTISFAGVWIYKGVFSE